MENKLQTEELDVRVFVQIERHKKLIQLFKELPVDVHFLFINAHDPLPLYYKFLSIYGDVVGWEYLNWNCNLNVETFCATNFYFDL